MRGCSTPRDGEQSPSSILFVSFFFVVRLDSARPSRWNCGGQRTDDCHVIRSSTFGALPNFHMDRWTMATDDNRISARDTPTGTQFLLALYHNLTHTHTHFWHWKRMRLLASLFVATGWATTSNGFSINDLQQYQKQGLSSVPTNPNELSQKNVIMTTRRETIQMPSQTPMVPWRVSWTPTFFMLSFVHTNKDSNDGLSDIHSLFLSLCTFLLSPPHNDSILFSVWF